MACSETITTILNQIVYFQPTVLPGSSLCRNTIEAKQVMQLNKGIFTVVVLSLLTACSEPPPPKPMVEVVVDKAITQPHKPGATFVGRLEATDDVQIKARVSGYILQRAFQEGETVNEGDLLYLLDPEQYKADLAQAKANLAKAQANVKVAERNYSRGQELLPKGAISESEMDDLTASKLEADAELEAAKAQVTAAEVNLSYTTIKAPFTGQIGRSEYSVGDLVGPDSGTLTTLVNKDPIKATFQVSEAAFIAAEERREERRGRISDIDVHIQLTNGRRYPPAGRIDYIANRIEQATGTIEARASIPNPDGVLYPGQYVTVLLELPDTIDAVMIPQAAVQVDQQGSFVMKVLPDQTVQRSNVVLGDRVDSKVVVRQGVTEGEMLVVRGLQRIRAGQQVQIKTMPPADASAVNESPAG